MMSEYLVDYPFEPLIPGSLDALEHVRQSSLWDTVEGHVPIYIHKG